MHDTPEELSAIGRGLEHSDEFAVSALGDLLLRLANAWKRQSDGQGTSSTAPGGTTSVSEGHRARLAEGNVFSQNGEDGVIESILRAVGPSCKVLLEIGVGTGEESNTRKLVEHDGWTGRWVDVWDIVYVPKGVEYVKKFVDRDNVRETLLGLPPRLGLLSIDIDGNDLWIWKELGPVADVVAIEYNSHFPPPQSVTVKYEPSLKWKETDYFGASLSALWKLGRSMGYELVHCDSTGVNAFFVHGDRLLRPLSPEEAFRPFSRKRYPKDERRMEEYPAS